MTASLTARALLGCKYAVFLFWRRGIAMVRSGQNQTGEKERACDSLPFH
jgi:hypothetical protein